MADDLDPERLVVHDALDRWVLPWLIHRAFGMSEVRQAIQRAGLTRDALEPSLLRAENLAITRCPEFEAVYRFVDRANGKIDTSSFESGFADGEWPIRSGIYYETRLRRPAPTSLYEAVCDWGSVALRDSVVPEVRRLINARLSGEQATTLSVGAIPGLRRVDDISYTVVTGSTRRFVAAVRRIHGSGTIGLAGPRGAGKTALIRRYLSGLHATEAEPTPMSVSVSCPVHYDARDFVLHLYAELCRAVLERAGDLSDAAPRKSVRSGWPYRLWHQFVRLVGGLVVAIAVVLLVARVDLGRPILPQLSRLPSSVPWWTQFLLLVEGFALAVVGQAAVGLVRDLVSLFRNRPDRPRTNQDTAAQSLAPAARRHYQQIRVLQTSTSGWSGKITLPMSSEASVTKSIQTAERPLTYPEVVDAFRRFTARCVATLGPIVLAIDELDKIDSPEQAQLFVNDIKGVLGVPGCLCLVSLSQDAIVTFERAELGVRDAFESAFDEVVAVGYLELVDSLELLRSRVIGIPESFGCLCHCLSGGLPRELIRVVRRVVEHRGDRPPASLEMICGELVRDDLAARVQEFRAVARRLDVRRGGVVLRSLARLQPHASASDLLDVAGNLIRAEDVDDLPPALDQLRWQAAMLAYHSATLRQVFDDRLDIRRVEQSRDLAGRPGSFDQLSNARNAITEDPRLAGVLVDEFREDWGLVTLPGPIGAGSAG